MPIKDGQALDLLQDMIEAKEHQWYNHQERDLSPQMVLISKEGLAMAFPDYAWEASKIYNEGVAGAIRMIWEALGRDDGDLALLDQVWLGTDGYCRVEADEGPCDVKRGELAKDFATNPASTVKEALTMTIAADDLCGGVEFQTAMITYVIGDGGRIEWDDTREVEEAGGAIGDAFKRLFDERSKL